jgi:hypothetical protein
VCDTDRGHRWQKMELLEEQIKLYSVVEIRFLIDNEYWLLNMKN